MLTHTRLQPLLPSHLSPRSITCRGTESSWDKEWLPLFQERAARAGPSCGPFQRPRGKRLPRAGWVNSPSWQQAASRLQTEHPPLG